MARQPTPEQRAQIEFTTTLKTQRRAAGEPTAPEQRGQLMAENSPRPEARHTLALVNAVAVGPGRATRDERRLMLARLLAQRAVREDDKSGQWTRLSKRLIQEIDRLEHQSQSAALRVAQQPFAPDVDLLNAVEREIGMQSVEQFLHALNRAVSAVAVRDGDSKPSAQTEEDQGDDHDN